MAKQTVEVSCANVLILTKVGTLGAAQNVTLALVVPHSLIMDYVRCYAKTPPSGSDIIVDVNKNGSTIFTTQANRPTVPNGLNKGNISATPDIPSLAEGDVITLDIDQVGSSTPGADLTVEVRCMQ